MTIKILHITPHLGGGVGKVLTNVIKYSDLNNSKFRHTIVCLEKPEHNSSNEIIICPTTNELNKLIENSDIVQLEYWNHPKLIEWLCTSNLSQMRLLIWCHNNGLYNPIVPKDLIMNSNMFLFTSHCSFENQEIRNLVSIKDKIRVVYASGGFEEFPDEINVGELKTISVGYVGSMNFSKLHPNYVDYLKEVNIPNFKVKMIGTPINKEILMCHCNKIEKPSLLEFTDYVPSIIDELKSINVLAYILNPEHYGTTENALLEAMSMGIIPVTLNNPAERYILNTYDTSKFRVHSSEEFGRMIKKLSHVLHDNPSQFQSMRLDIAKFTRNRFSIGKTVQALNNYYNKILSTEKRKIDFSRIFGKSPDEWFLSCQKNTIKSIFKDDGTIDLNDEITHFSKHMLFEKTKGSVFHFSEYFPENRKLKIWSENMKLLQ